MRGPPYDHRFLRSRPIANATILARAQDGAGDPRGRAAEALPRATLSQRASGEGAVAGAVSITGRGRRRFAGGTPGLVGGLTVIALCLAWCLLLYRPWEMIHFPMRDQGTLLGNFRVSDSFGEAFAQLARTLLEEGRVYLLSTLALTASWSAFGTDATEWQIARFVTSFLCVILAWCALRRCGATRLGAVLGASLFAVAGSVASGWMYTMVLEMYGLPFLLGALWISAGFHASTRPLASAAGMAGLLVLAISAKEPFIACSPAVVLLASCHRGGGVYGPPQIAGPHRTMAITVLGVVIICGFIPALLAKSLAPNGHAGNYSLEQVTWAHAGVLVTAIGSIATWAWFYPANLVFGTLVTVGAVAGLRRNARSTAWAAAVALSLPISGWILYLPWRFTVGYYAVPFLFGLSLLLAHGVTHLEQAGPRWRIGVAFAGIVMLGYASLVARNAAAQFQAESFVEGAAAEAIAKRVPTVLYVAAGEGIGWVAADMRSYVQAYGGSPQLSVVPVSCATNRWPEAKPGSAVVAFSHICPETTEWAYPSERIQRGYRFLSWITWASERREASVRIWYR